MIEIPGAYGYLFHSFLSPHTNTSSDAYYGGQPFENFTRFILYLVKAVRPCGMGRKVSFRAGHRLRSAEGVLGG